MDEDWVNVDEPKQGYKPPKSVDDGKRQLTDLATKDNGPVFVSISVTEPVKVSKDGEKYVAYVVNTETNLKAFPRELNVVKRRYREFVWLRTHFEYERLNTMKIKLPQLPAKTVFAKTDPAFLEKRRIALQNFLQAVVNEGELLQEPILLKFLTVEDLPRAVGYVL